MNKRLYPVSESFFNEHIHPLIVSHYSRAGQQSKGVNRAGVTTKLHLALSAENHVIEATLTAGNTADISIADDMMSDVAGCYIVEDMGYDSDDHRDFLRSQNNVPVIPGRKN